MTVLAKGTKLSVGDGASPEVFTPITGVVEINVPNPDVADLETTDHDTTNRSKTYQPGLIEPGDISIMYKYDPANSEQVQLETDRDAGTVTNYQTEVPTSPADIQTFSAYVKSVEPATPIDGLFTKRATLKVAGAVT